MVVGERVGRLLPARADGRHLAVVEQGEVADERVGDLAGGEDAPPHRAVAGQRLGPDRTGGDVERRQVVWQAGHVAHSSPPRREDIAVQPSGANYIVVVRPL